MFWEFQKFLYLHGNQEKPILMAKDLKSWLICMERQLNI